MTVNAIKITDKDNVATVMQHISAGQAVCWSLSEKAVTAVSDIPFGHKIAVRAVSAGELIYKYGEIIGEATQNIPAGAHVHVLNIDSRRARGDKNEL